MKLSIKSTIPEIQNPISQVCTQSQFDEPIYEEICNEIKEAKKYHRKQWEFVYIIQALKQRGLLKPGAKGLGFGVGQEPLPALFAKYGVKVIATDLEPEDEQSKAWASTNQRSANKEQLNLTGICPKEQFDNLVDFRFVNMRNIPEDLKGFDFVWSSCSLEHIGGLKLSEKFIFDSLKCLKPGGVAIHTTEYNISSNLFTSSKGYMIIFRRRDIKNVARKAISQGDKIELNFHEGTGELDFYYDKPPYLPDKHLRLKIYYRNKYFGYRFIATSIGLIIDKKNN